MYGGEGEAERKRKAGKVNRKTRKILRRRGKFRSETGNGEERKRQFWVKRFFVVEQMNREQSRITEKKKANNGSL